MARNVVQSSGENGIFVFATNSRFDRNRSSYNLDYGIKDQTSGSGTGGTANTYTSNVCLGNGLGDSNPSGLCS